MIIVKSIAVSLCHIYSEGVERVWPIALPKFVNGESMTSMEV